LSIRAHYASSWPPEWPRRPCVLPLLPPLTFFYPPQCHGAMGVAIGRPVRGPPAADSRIRSILLPVTQSPPSPLRGCSLDDALSSRCFKRWQLNKNCSGLPSFFPLPPYSTMSGEAFVKRQQTGHPGYFDHRSYWSVANDSRPHDLEVSTQQVDPAVVHES
jgi:hypothetical protein